MTDGRRWVWLAIGAALLGGRAFAALANPPHRDVHWVAEHVPESAQDARAFAIPWPRDDRQAGRWRLFAGVAGQDATAEFVRQRGGLLTLGAERAVGARSRLLVFGFYDRFTVGGTSGDDVLRVPFGGAVGLDLPERARFSRPRGTVSHAGIGVAWARELGAASPARWSLEAGAFASRLDLTGYRFDFVLLGGADAGRSGVLDHSLGATYLTPFVGLERRVPLGERWLLRPRGLVGIPLPNADFPWRIRGAGFGGTSNDAGNRAGKIGDGFVVLGAGLLDRRSGFELDLGTALSYSVFEHASHTGIDRAFLLSLVWHF